jgi:hypothetical protein
VPVAAVGETVAVSVMLVPAVVDVLEAAKVVVEAVVELLVLFEPQPMASTAITAKMPSANAQRANKRIIMRLPASSWFM